MIEVREIIDELSKKYRDGLKKESDITNEINNIEKELANKNIAYIKYKDNAVLLLIKTQELNDIRNYNNGLHEGREIVMRFL